MKLFRLYIALAFILGLNAHLFSQDKIEQRATMQKFYENYRNDDYKAMRKQMNWLMRLFLPTEAVKSLFESDKMMFGEPQIVDITNKSAQSLNVRVKFSKDTTEVMDMGFALSDKNKIIGLRRSGEKLVFPQKESTESLDNRINAVDSLINIKKKSSAFNGCVLVIEKGVPVFSSCIGESDFTTHTQLNDTSVFELASCSKQFTAVAIMMLAERGKLNLEDPITKYLTELPYHDVKIRHLLNHTGGLPDYMDLMEKKWDKSKVAFNQDLIAYYAKHKPKRDFKAGEKHEYSNTGYAFLASIVERASGMTFSDFMKNEIFEPLGMSHTRIFNTRRSSSEKINNYAFGYVYDDKNNRYVLPDSIPEQNIVYWLDGITGDGTVNSCIKDLVLWENGLRQNKLISKSMMTKAMSNTSLESGEKVEYGYGWGVQQDDKSQHIAYHSGSWPGYLTMIIHFMETDRSVIVLSNNEYFFIQKMATKIASIMSR